MKLLIVYASGEGQTEKIARFAAEIAANQHHEVDVVNAATLSPDVNLAAYEGALVGASIHMGKYHPDVLRFVKNNRRGLDRIPTAFFCVCMAAEGKNSSDQVETRRYIDNFLTASGWKPRTTAAFAGAIRYSRYNFLIRLIMKAIARKKGLATDTSRDHEYTDWDAVKRFVERFVTNSRDED